MGCSPSKVSKARISWAEDELNEGGQRVVEPAKLRQAMRMKKYELVAGVKLAAAGLVEGGLYYEDNRSCSSLGTKDRDRLDTWVGELPCTETATPLNMPLETGSKSGKSVCTAADLPPSPISSTHSLSLPTDESGSTHAPPIRLSSKLQLDILERSLSTSVGERSQGSIKLSMTPNAYTCSPVRSMNLPTSPPPLPPTTIPASRTEHYRTAEGAGGATKGSCSSGQNTPVVLFSCE